MNKSISINFFSTCLQRKQLVSSSCQIQPGQQFSLPFLYFLEPWRHIFTQIYYLILGTWVFQLRCSLIWLIFFNSLFLAQIQLPKAPGLKFHHAPFRSTLLWSTEWQNSNHQDVWRFQFSLVDHLPLANSFTIGSALLLDLKNRGRTQINRVKMLNRIERKEAMSEDWECVSIWSSECCESTTAASEWSILLNTHKT